MSEVKVNKISPRTDCGTVQLGDSGDTITIPAGATITNSGTQTGFGRTGTVDWQTGSIKTSTFTAVNGEGYFCNTSGGTFSLTLPASPSAGNIVALQDYANNFGTAKLTLDRNGSNINGSASNFDLTTDGAALTLVYVDATKGWLVVYEGSTSLLAQFVAATGGTVSTCGNFKIHRFTGPGTFEVTCGGNSGGSNTVDYLVVGGGGGGGGDRGGGGGAGGFRASSGTASGCYCAGPGPLTSPVSALPVTAQSYPITVGGGGPGSPGSNQPSAAANGNPAVFSTVIGTGGGGGMSSNHPEKGQPGGSGGAGAGSGGTACSAKGAGNTPPVSPPQGNPGGKGFDGPNPSSGGGGGGAANPGQDGGPGKNPAPTNPTSAGAGPGGLGVSTSITGSAVKLAGGGGGAHPNAQDNLVLEEHIQVETQHSHRR